MTIFEADQLERLNPRIQREIKQLNAISLCVLANTHPPSIDEMETYVTCLDAGEWNTSCHLKLIPNDQVGSIRIILFSCAVLPTGCSLDVLSCFILRVSVLYRMEN